MINHTDKGFQNKAKSRFGQELSPMTRAVVTTKIVAEFLFWASAKCFSPFGTQRKMQ